MSYSYSFEERVIKKTNDLIVKFSGNLKRFSSNHIYAGWLSDGLVKNEFAVGKVGETYGEIYLIRTTKASLKKNKPKVRQFNELLKRKRNSNPTIDELANFIGYVVTKDKPKNKTKGEEANSKVEKPKPLKVTITNEIDEEEEDKDNGEKDKLTANELIQLPEVDNWEDL